MLLRETGARAAHLPVFETLCCGALTLAAHGSEAQRALLRDVVTGARVLTPAVRELAPTTYADGATPRRTTDSRRNPWSRTSPRSPAARS